ncbi:MAG: hypothetical protein LBE72_01720 [Rickettsia sp.]|jgi:CTP-dependent riboflavin kinase|nr:hypothetical protein [Rickettsia sp.]
MFKIVFDAWNNQILLSASKHSKSYCTSKKINKVLKELYDLNRLKLIDLDVSKVAQETGRDKKTVRRYIKEAESNKHLIRTKKKHKQLQIELLNPPEEEALSEIYVQYIKESLEKWRNEVNRDLNEFQKHKSKNL